MHEQAFFVNSLEVEFELCNLRCKYCWLTLGNLDTFRKGNKLYSRENNAQLKFDYTVDTLAENIRRILDKTKAAMLKVSGGEIFLLPELIDEFSRRKDNYTKIVLVSNGLKITEAYLDKLDPAKFAFQISLDGHTDEANALRYPGDTKNTEKILTAIEKLTKRGFTVEISCVLTDHNVPFLKDFVVYFGNRFPDVTIIPFPVRFSDYFLSATDQNMVAIQSAWEAAPLGTLPPEGYKTALTDMVRSRKSNACYLPIISAPVCEDGSMPLCPCGIIGNRGNVFEMDAVVPLDRQHPDVQRVLWRQVPKCASCFTHFDVMNLYIEDKISYAEMLQCGIYRDTALLDELDAYKKLILSHAD